MLEGQNSMVTCTEQCIWSWQQISHQIALLNSQRFDFGILISVHTATVDFSFDCGMFTEFIKLYCWKRRAKTVLCSEFIAHRSFYLYEAENPWMHELSWNLAVYGESFNFILSTLYPITLSKWLITDCDFKRRKWNARRIKKYHNEQIFNPENCL